VDFQGGPLPATASKPATSAKATIKILYGESDEKVLAGRAAEMQKAGHQVTAALHRKGVLEELRGSTYDLVVLGATLSKDDRHHLPYMVKKAAQGTKVLVMHAGTHHHEVDGSVDSEIGMIFLLEKIAAMLHPVTR
jgi:DNA-binding NtrC family response regulator